MYRFDGVRAVPWQPPTGQDLPSPVVYNLLVARDGALWIGTMNGVASWKGGKLTRYPEIDGQMIWALREDREGTMWSGGVIGTFPGPETLCAIGRSGVAAMGRMAAWAEEWLRVFMRTEGRSLGSYGNWDLEVEPVRRSSIHYPWECVLLKVSPKTTAASY